MATVVNYLLDTNILVAYVRAGPLGEYVERTYSLMAQPYKPLLCVVSVGEILALARKLGWGSAKAAIMRSLLKEIVLVDVNIPEIQEAYAEICYFSEAHGQKKGQNDYWIAASAKVTGATLLTTDKDFDHLHDIHITRILIDESAARGL
jgi:tRNA(fMet)-specific endonuclease VapC